MVYKRFYTIIFLRVFFILANCTLIGWALGKPYLNLFTITGVVILLIQTWALGYYVTKGNKSLRNFLINLKSEPSSFDFIERSDLAAFKGIEDILKDIVEIIHRSRLEKEKSFQYLKTLVDCIGVGILVWDESKTITLYNKAVLSILRTDKVYSLSDLSQISNGFINAIDDLVIGKPSVYTFSYNGENRNLSLNLSIFKMNGIKFSILSIEDIGKAIEQTEVSAWKKLISVITHEMVNSIAPIKSLSKTITRTLNRIDNEGYSNEISAKCVDAAHAIEERSVGLEAFINSYKSFYKLPEPIMSNVVVSQLFNSIKPLANELIGDSKVTIVWKSDDFLTIDVDERLITQVIINLIKNAVEVIGESDGLINVYAITKNNACSEIVVENSGPSIPQELSDKIFVPFFTTKENGSGVGLSLSRQIMMMHGGNLSLISIPNEPVRFVLELG